MQKLLVDAGMLEERRAERTAAAQATADVARRSRTHTDGEQAEPAKEGHVDLLAVCVERTVAMLALTAFHDVMKIEALLPRVGRAHAPFLGYQEGDVINDHDCALAYVLSHYSDLLPSFVQLMSADQLTVKFTQSRMQFNHGWLVQGEAPPSALFAKFKFVMRTEGVSPADVAFYFVHWLTDLAGQRHLLQLVGRRAELLPLSPDAGPAGPDRLLVIGLAGVYRQGQLLLNR